MARFSVGGDDDRDDRLRSGDEDRLIPGRRLDKIRRTQSSTSSVRPVARQASHTIVMSESESEAYRYTDDYLSESPIHSPYSPPSRDSPFGEEDDQAVDQQEFQVGPVESSNSAGNGVTLSELDVLDCPICTDPLTPPVYQCENGHLACGLCCCKIRNKCPSCSMPIGYNRCRGMEKVLEAAKIACQNTRYGCREKISYCKKLDHEKSCKYAPCSCPDPGCNYTGMNKSLYMHFTTCHSDAALNIRFGESYPVLFLNTSDHIVLLERRERTVFVINHVVVPLGRLVNVICLAPSSSNIKYFCEVTATRGDKLIMLRGSVELAPKFTAQSPKKNCLLITSDFHNHLEEISLDIMIRKI